jgi:hypothetical protein
MSYYNSGQNDKNVSTGVATGDSLKIFISTAKNGIGNGSSIAAALATNALRSTRSPSFPA